MWLPRTQGAALCEAGPQPSVLFFVARALEKEECRTVAMQDAALSLARLHWRLPGDVDTALAGHTALRLEHVQVFFDANPHLNDARVCEPFSVARTSRGCGRECITAHA